MAETIVNLVLEKITAAAVKEVLHLWGVEKQVDKVKHELDWVQAFLKDADRKQIVNARQKQWVKEVRDVAYRIEDAIDTFLCEVPKRKPGKRGCIKNIFRKIIKVPVIHNLGSEINEILETLKDIKGRKETYGISTLGEGSGHGKRLPIRPPVLPDIEDSHVVGFDKDIENVVSQLLDEGTPRRCVVSIVGQGGLGKTTLAKKVYNSDKVKTAFEIRLWITVSQEFKVTDVVIKILEQLRRIDQDERGKDEINLLTELFRSLKEKRYLLIIDDVWSEELWISIEQALPNDKNGSRILMTTRKSEVAKHADAAHQPYVLDFLTPESSLELFLKIALLNQENQNECSDDILDLAKQFVNKCGRLPLALVVLGGLLAKKQPTYLAWNRVMQGMNWHTNDQKGCTEIIGTSYDDLPFSLKSCFQYLAMFPEDHVIKVKPLLCMWIAEGFIPDEDGQTLEETAESFLEDLVQRSMIQVVKRDYFDDSISSCRMHDLLRDVAIQKAKEDNFLMVCSTLDEVQSCGKARRVAVHNIDCNELMKYASNNLRTLLCFNSKIPDCSGHKLLKVFGDINSNSEHTARAPIDMKCFDGLSQLKYLQLMSRYWNFKSNPGSYEKVIGTMRSLQTLIVGKESIYIDFLPNCLWGIRTLRHILCRPYVTPQLTCTTDLPNLQTICPIQPHESWDYANLPNLPNLRSLYIENIQGTPWDIEITQGIPWGLVVAFLHTLKYLTRLTINTISGEDIPTEVIDMKEFPFYQNLTYLRYAERLFCPGLNFTMFPTHLVVLALFDSELQQDPMAVLEKLEGLKNLLLSGAYLKQTMKCSATGFPRLQSLAFTRFDELENWEIEEGAMPRLRGLYIAGCSKLQVPHGLQHLTSLTKLTWCFDGDDSDPMKAKEIRSICQHVPSIQFHAEVDEVSNKFVHWNFLSEF